MATIKIWYMRDNHTFMRLPNDVESAMDALFEDIVVRSETYGMLCARDMNGREIEKPIHMGDKYSWPAFKDQAEGWLTRVIAKEQIGENWILGLA